MVLVNPQLYLRKLQATISDIHFYLISRFISRIHHLRLDCNKRLQQPQSWRWVKRRLGMLQSLSSFQRRPVVSTGSSVSTPPHPSLRHGKNRVIYRSAVVPSRWKAQISPAISWDESHQPQPHPCASTHARPLHPGHQGRGTSPFGTKKERAKAAVSASFSFDSSPGGESVRHCEGFNSWLHDPCNWRSRRHRRKAAHPFARLCLLCGTCHFFPLSSTYTYVKRLTPPLSLCYKHSIE